MKNKLIFYIKNFYFISPIIFYFGERSLIAYDEGIYALQAKWILENNNWITPMKWGSIVDDRTIGIQFLIAFCQKFFGEHLLNFLNLFYLHNYLLKRICLMLLILN